MYHDAKSVIVSRERFKVTKSKHRIRIVKLLILLSQMFQIKIFLPNYMGKWRGESPEPRSRSPKRRTPIASWKPSSSSSSESDSSDEKRELPSGSKTFVL